MSVLWLAVIVGLIPLTLWVVKRSGLHAGAVAGGGSMRVVSSLPVGPQQRLVMVEVGEGESRRWVMLGVTPQHISTLHDLPPGQEMQPGVPVPSFAQAVARFKAGRQGAEGEAHVLR